MRSTAYRPTLVMIANSAATAAEHQQQQAHRRLDQGQLGWRHLGDALRQLGHVQRAQRGIQQAQRDQAQGRGGDVEHHVVQADAHAQAAAAADPAAAPLLAALQKQLDGYRRIIVLLADEEQQSAADRAHGHRRAVRHPVARFQPPALRHPRHRSGLHRIGTGTVRRRSPGLPRSAARSARTGRYRFVATGGETAPAHRRRPGSTR
ncbi:hypothetical protein G6F46_013697 [Rhizopus delemar]|nr:hypothetical protein G6F46_013697 [Rhizopus delemar]